MAPKTRSTSTNAPELLQDAPTAYPYKKISTAVAGEVKELRKKWPRPDCAMRVAEN